MDWHTWHNRYENSPALKKRLVLVREHLSECLGRSPSGEIRIIGVCAGDGRDVLGTLADHKRRSDARARLVERDPDLVADGRNASEALGLSRHVEFVNGDATNPGCYRAAAPANIVMMCGMLGLVGHSELSNVVRAMQALCGRNGYVIWTRRLDWRDGVRQTKALRKLMAEAGFRQTRLNVTSFGALFSMAPKSSFAVGTHRYDGDSVALPEGGRLFTISDAPIDR